ncbi:peptide-methionine (S)-S-oxide reductase MsrA [Croceicoccus gelatinilyticus]|uniref:peptide-methionine (S)-S-oxide reductase MsrA n=1 Tax=Croceicoccus gelatinilyticus TaxID=2835536 RepID=UPI001BCDD540|nr:peptide-methionine (S)-S-oxide reductase MsrA [Croceicoccus gelatinilyticus]MBS7669487.1 peptide-methionine (S)-S-oxide reductase MsrA [Croceicoccus gelatinilyticus]
MLGAAALLGACQQPAIAAASGEEAVATPAAAIRATEEGGLKTAIFAGGCFWGVEGVFSHVKGVTSAVSGYHGGSKRDATYKRVTSGATGHAEAVKVTYDPNVVRYDELLRIFFAVVADPTTLNRQGPDHGSQYRSAFVPTSAEQARVAKAYIAQLGKAKLWDKPIVTKIEKQGTFYRAEAYHQDFMAKNPNHGYIRRWDRPKVEALKTLFPADYTATFRKN